MLVLCGKIFIKYYQYIGLKLAKIFICIEIFEFIDL